MGIKELARRLVGKKKKPAAPPAQLTDKHATKVTALNKETANAVYQVDYKKNAGMQQGYFKPDQPQAPARNAVAASTIAGKLGMSDLVPETKYATHKVAGPNGKKSKQTGAVSAGVSGKAFSKNKFSQKFASLEDAGLSSVQEFEETLAPSGYELRPDGTLWSADGPEYNNDMDLSQKETQSSLNRLQWFDAIIGNKDRHGGNLIHDPSTGMVYGIDNDLSFDQGQALGDNTVDSREAYLGLPDQVDQPTATAILQLTASDIEAALKAAGPTAAIDDKAIADAKARLKEAQDKVTNLVDQGKIVGEWNDATFAEAANQGDGKVARNYLQRQLHAMKRVGAGGLSNPAKGVPDIPAKPAVQQPAVQQPAVQQPVVQPASGGARPTGGLRRPNYGALRKGAIPNVPAPTGPKNRPTGGRTNPQYNALRRGQVPGMQEELEEKVMRPRLRTTGRLGQ